MSENLNSYFYAILYAQFTTNSVSLEIYIGRPFLLFNATKNCNSKIKLIKLLIIITQF